MDWLRREVTEPERRGVDSHGNRSGFRIQDTPTPLFRLEGVGGRTAMLGKRRFALALEQSTPERNYLNWITDLVLAIV